MEKQSGSCVCGAVTFEIADDFDQFHLCHCTQCQKFTGTAHASNLFTQPGNIVWLTGKASVARYDLPGRSISNAFCGQCGSRVPYLSLSGEVLVVPAGTLDKAPSLSPDANIFWPERAQWYDGAVNAKPYDRYKE